MIDSLYRLYAVHTFKKSLFRRFDPCIRILLGTFFRFEARIGYIFLQGVRLFPVRFWDFGDRTCPRLRRGPIFGR